MIDRPTDRTTNHQKRTDMKGHRGVTLQTSMCKWVIADREQKYADSDLGRRWGGGAMSEETAVLFCLKNVEEFQRST